MYSAWLPCRPIPVEIAFWHNSFLPRRHHSQVPSPFCTQPTPTRSPTLREVTPKAGPNQVVIKIHASGLCYTDVHLTRGLFALPFPRVLGHEPVGEIVEVGPGVTSRKVGDRVGGLVA